MKTSFFNLLITAFLSFPLISLAQIASDTHHLPTAKMIPSSPTATTPASDEYRVLDNGPVPLNYETVCKQITYPDVARSAGKEGLLQIRVLVDEKGNYVRHQVQDSQRHLLVKAVIPHLPRLRFKPAYENGRPVSAWMTLPFRFRIR